MTNYKAMAEKFCKDTKTKVIINYKEQKFNPWNATDYTANWMHNIYKVTIKRNGKQFTFDFTDSKHNTDHGIKPDAYDVLACLTKYDVGSFEDFVNDFGYEMFDDFGRINKESQRIYKAVVKEYNNVVRLFEDVMEELAEIC